VQRRRQSATPPYVRTEHSKLFEKTHPVFLFHAKESKRRKHVRRRSLERRQDDPIGGVHQGDEAIGRGCRGWP
jgi:hypothetical protein